jgi:hypothetical protein
MHTASRPSVAIVGFSSRFWRPLERACCDQPDVVDEGGYYGESKVRLLALDCVVKAKD